MADKDLAANGTQGAYVPPQLFAGEAPITTTPGIVKAGQVLAKYTVMAKDVNNKLVPYNAAAADVAVVGGATSQTAKAPETRAIGILATAVDTSGTGSNADTSVTYFSGGCFNHAMLVWPSGTSTLQLRKAAFDRTPILIEQVLG